MGMTIAHGRPIVAQDVIDAINSKYPEYANIVPSPLKGQPFVAGLTNSTNLFGDTSQALATALAMISVGLPARSKANIIFNNQTYQWTGDFLYTKESTGTLVRAASSYGTSSIGVGVDLDTALAAAGGTNHLAALASFYQATGPFFGYDSITFNCFANGDVGGLVGPESFTLNTSTTAGSQSVSASTSSGPVTNTIDISLAGPLDNTCVVTTKFSTSGTTTGSPPNPSIATSTGQYLEGAGSGIQEGVGWVLSGPGGGATVVGYNTVRNGTPVTFLCIINFAD